MTKRSKKKRQQRREWARSINSMPTVHELLSHEKHLEQHPNCTYGPKTPHFVPPSFGQIGFYMCDPPADITNHTRCVPPYDHEHPDHMPINIFGLRPGEDWLDGQRWPTDGEIDP